jgi:hypothetical protein
MLNLNESHTGADIEYWCKENPNNDLAKEIKKEYFSKNGNRPSDRVYYFIERFPKVQLARDFEKSPRTRYSRVRKSY